MTSVEAWGSMPTGGECWELSYTIQNHLAVYRHFPWNPKKKVKVGLGFVRKRYHRAATMMIQQLAWQMSLHSSHPQAATKRSAMIA
jgi:hypothetical protein